MKKKCIVLFSGGLDSRLAVKIMQKKGFEVEAVHFNLPFGCGCCDFGCNFNFAQMSGVKFKIFDVTKGKLLREYLKLLKEGKHGRGAGFNPCKDCKIWMFKKAKKYADNKGVNVIATGEVLGQRPMSQTSKAMEIIDDAVGFKLERPLIDLGFEGRRRDKQMALAKKFGIKYPLPGGGCLLCEKELKKRFEILIKDDLINEKTLSLTMVGRHFFKKGCWFVVGKNKIENDVIEKFRSCVKSAKAKPAVYFSKKNCRNFAEELQEDYKTKGIKKYSGEKL
jgi:predicted subunit of tRNA(5-methylaminomethyl-2-thiouridylate) methyltransferase